MMIIWFSLLIIVETLLIIACYKGIKQVAVLNERHEAFKIDFFQELEDLKYLLKQIRLKLDQRSASQPKTLSPYEIGELLGKILTKVILFKKFSVFKLAMILMPKASRIIATLNK